MVNFIVLCHCIRKFKLVESISRDFEILCIISGASFNIGKRERNQMFRFPTDIPKV